MSSTDRPDRDAPRSLHALERLLARVGMLLTLPEDLLSEQREEISKWSITEHLFHLILACDLSLGNVRSLVRDKGRLVREPEDRQADNLVMLRRGRIPRGVAPAPRFVTPPAKVDFELLGQLHGEMQTLRTELAADIDAIHAAPRCVPHQLLGDLYAAEWLRFARAHTAHHLLIVREIRNAQRGF